MRVMAVTIGLIREVSLKVNWIFMPPFSNTAVLETSGEAEDRGGGGGGGGGGGEGGGVREGGKGNDDWL